MALLLGVLLMVFLGSLQVLRRVENSRLEQVQGEALAANEALLRKWLELANQPLRRFVQDFAQWPAMGRFMAKPDPGWADQNLRPNLALYEAHAIWVLDANGQPIYSAQEVPGPTLSVPEIALNQTQSAERSFFSESRDGLLEVWCEPVASEKAGGVAGGWLLVARLWNSKHLHALGQLSGSETFLLPLKEPSLPNGSASELRIPLPDQAGRPLRLLVARQTLPDYRTSLARDTLAAYLFLAFGVLLVLALWLGARQWLLKPLETISESLRRDDPALIQVLRQDRTELGRVAQLVESAFSQKAALNREIEEHRRTEEALRESEARLRHALELRARLARDLHDGVIQSIYAAGLGLEGAMTQMDKDSEGALVRLRLCRQSLNEVIREVRGFINGIEPEALHHQGFDQELASLVRTMQALWPVLISVQTAPTSVARLTHTQEMHAIHICRECISNAVRHGNAREIDIRLEETENGMSVLRVRDNGRGFNPSTVSGTGSGLGNLASRARELAGHLQIDSHPGGGAIVAITFPLAPPRT